MPENSSVHGVFRTAYVRLSRLLSRFWSGHGAGKKGTHVKGVFVVKSCAFQRQDEITSHRPRQWLFMCSPSPPCFFRRLTQGSVLYALAQPSTAHRLLRPFIPEQALLFLPVHFINMSLNPLCIFLSPRPTKSLWELYFACSSRASPNSSTQSLTSLGPQPLVIRIRCSGFPSSQNFPCSTSCPSSPT